MSTMQGQFIWYELVTTDAEAATAFYQPAFGWDAADAGLPDRTYTILSASGVPVGGAMKYPGREVPQPNWKGYIGVDDVDAMAAQIKAAGGAIHIGPDDIPTVGRFAVASDPQGAGFCLFKPLEKAPMPPPPAGMPGTIGWHELATSDQEAGFAFYAGLFGWTKADAIDMGPMGIYQLFSIGGLTVGGMMTAPPGLPGPAWRYYVNVADINATAERIKAAGGQVVNGPHPVPGGSWIVNGVDPQGAMFAAVAPG